MYNSLLNLFLTFLKLGFMSIGGGYAIIPLIQEDVVTMNAWLSIQEFTDIITISQMTPGPLAINTASFVGIRIHGVLGAIIATLGCITGGFIISILLYKFFMKYNKNSYISNILSGLKATSVGLIGASASTMLLLAFFNSDSLNVSISKLNIIACVVFGVSLYTLRKWKLNPILVILCTGLLGLIVY